VSRLRRLVGRGSVCALTQGNGLGRGRAAYGAPVEGAASVRPGSRSVAVGPRSLKSAPTGPPAAGPVGPDLTEPGPTAGRALRWAGRALPTSAGRPVSLRGGRSSVAVVRSLQPDPYDLVPPASSRFAVAVAARGNPGAPQLGFDPLLTAEDVAALLRVSKAWVYAETRAQRIPHVPLGRYVRTAARLCSPGSWSSSGAPGTGSRNYGRRTWGVDQQESGRRRSPLREVGLLLRPLADARWPAAQPPDRAIADSRDAGRPDAGPG